MSSLWATLLPLIIGSAVMPIQIIITLLLLRADAGRITAVAWLAGVTLMRFVQGAVAGLMVSASESADNSDGANAVTSTLLIVVALLFLVMAVKKATHDEDPDAPPPAWLARTQTLRPGKAFLAGLLLMGVAVKFWVFSAGAASAIGEADLSKSSSVLTFLVFVLLSQTIQILSVMAAYLAPQRSEAVLGRLTDWLTAKSRVITVILGVVFGIWFLVKGLRGLGVL